MSGTQAAQDSTVTVEGMADALDELVKAADATDIVKGQVQHDRPGGGGNGVEYSGHNDERGKVGGGGASASDEGGIDNMMIGKLTAAGFNAAEIASFAAFKKKEAEGDGDDDADDEEMQAMKAKMVAHKKKTGSLKGFDPKAEFGKSGNGEGEPLVKSFDEFRKDPDVAAAIDVSPYLEAMTMRTAEQIDGLRKSFSERASDQNDMNRKQAAALYQIGSLLKSQSAVIDALAKRLNIVERTPNPPKGVTTAAALHKSMPGEAGRPVEKLSKSELLGTLSYMNLEKGIRHIGSQKTSDAIYMLEGGGLVSPEIIQAATDFLATNPTVAADARAYR